MNGGHGCSVQGRWHMQWVHLEDASNASRLSLVEEQAIAWPQALGLSYKLEQKHTPVSDPEACTVASTHTDHYGGLLHIASLHQCLEAHCKTTRVAEHPHARPE